MTNLIFSTTRFYHVIFRMLTLGFVDILAVAYFPEFCGFFFIY
nr:MAG TPA: hypothetical protein [Caudoviricetes sp.]